MASDGIPCDKPSKVPEAVTETADTIKPKLMMRRAVAPISKVCALVVNSPIRFCGKSRHSTIPTAIIDAIRVRDVV